MREVALWGQRLAGEIASGGAVGKPEENVVQRSVSRSPLSFSNQLGIPIDIFESAKKDVLFRLHDSTPTPYPVERLETGTRNIVNIQSVLPSAFDITLHDSERVWQPLLALPLNVNRSQAFQLLPVSGTALGAAGGGGGQVVEELFENERWHPFTRAWADPWAGDPSRWTDAYGKQRPEPRQFPLGERWVWANDWKVDVPLQVSTPGRSVQTDTDGWQYGVSFNSFRNDIDKRSQRPLDSVRRRRWTR